jgi:hypothetical protein
VHIYQHNIDYLIEHRRNDIIETLTQHNILLRQKLTKLNPRLQRAMQLMLKIKNSSVPESPKDSESGKNDMHYEKYLKVSDFVRSLLNS